MFMQYARKCIEFMTLHLQLKNLLSSFNKKEGIELELKHFACSAFKM